MTEIAKRRHRRQTLASALAQARKAGMEPTSATLAPDGSVTLAFGGTAPIEKPATRNPWDQVLSHEPA